MSLSWDEALARQPGGDGPRVLHSSGEFIAFTERLRIGFSFKAEAALAAQPKSKPASRAVIVGKRRALPKAKS